MCDFELANKGHYLDIGENLNAAWELGCSCILIPDFDDGIGDI